ncbi:hypothetical protein [Micromonospora chersina]|uniref:hypothetical protein n=1 Tax=Micromonospora chersina TaxID=47854 RepID=UPI003711E6A7
MQRNVKKTLAKAAALSLLSVSLYGITTAAPAEAYCSGKGYPFTGYVYLGSSDVRIGKEVPNSGTCDGLSDYYAKVYDIYTDGSCVYVDYLETSGVEGKSCDSAGASFNYSDPQRNSLGYERIYTNSYRHDWLNEGF